MKKICILTATRAEYGLLKPVIVRLRQEESVEVMVVATGMHLSTEFGLTFQEIEKDGIPIHRKIPILLDSDTPSAISSSMGLALIAFGNYFEETKPDMLVVLGDRYEALAVSIAAMNQRIPIAHIHGGEKTEGAIDEAIRHSITKMSMLHFTSTMEYKNRVIQLGEQPERVFYVGALGVENIKSLPLLSKNELEKEIGFTFDKQVLMVTYHPVTLEEVSSKEQFLNLLSALDEIEDIKIIFTKANADADGRIINQMIDEYVVKHADKSIAFTSMGQLRYLSALQFCSAVVGNSSSGIIEAPSFHIPTVNIGDRQLGRVQAKSTINCGVSKEKIKSSILTALSEEGKELAKKSDNPYEGNHTSKQIVTCIIDYLQREKDMKKRFYDLNQANEDKNYE